MSGEYTPTVDEVRGVYVASGFRENLPHSHQSLAEWRAEFDRWLVRVRAEAQVQALTEFVADVTDQVALTDNAEGREWAPEDYRHGLRSALMQALDRADRIAREAGIEQEDEG